MYMIHLTVNVCNISSSGQYCCIEMNVFWGQILPLIFSCQFVPLTCTEFVYLVEPDQGGPEARQ